MKSNEQAPPKLPQELEKEILEYAFFATKDYRPRNWQLTLNLMLVSRCAHEWWSAGRRGYPSNARKPNLTDLALWTWLDTRVLLDVLVSKSNSETHLNRLSTNLSSLAADDIAGPGFKYLTHLDVTRMTTGLLIGADAQAKEKAKWTAVTRLPHLTHLIINEELPDPRVILHTLLQGCKTLKILVLAHRSGYNLFDESAHTAHVAMPLVPMVTILSDSRLVLLKVSRYTTEDWRAGAEGQMDLYSVAEYVARAKRAGYKDQDTAWIPRHGFEKELKALGYVSSS